MIEMKSKTGSWPGNTPDWMTVPSGMFGELVPPVVRHFIYRIDGIVYTERSKAFIKAFEYEKLIRQLREHD